MAFVGDQVSSTSLDFFRSDLADRGLGAFVRWDSDYRQHLHCAGNGPTVKKTDFKPRVLILTYKAIRLGILELFFHSVSLHFIHGKKGLRQGRPLSDREIQCHLGLFLFCMEYFSRLIKRKTTDSYFNFHPKCEKLKITHLLFADDLMMFSRGDLPSIHILMECLQEFRDVSGLAVNTSKSSIFMAGIENNILCDILARIEFTRGEMPVRCLGIPLAAQRLSVRDYSPLIDQIANSISRWAAKSLSFAGRLELIRSVIQGLECFWLQIFPLPAAVVEKSTGFVGIFSGTPNEHRLLGRISVISNMKGVLASGIHKLGTWLSLPEFYGTSTGRQTRFGYSGSTLSISKEDQFGIGNRRRATHHSFNGLPKSATESLTPLARPRWSRAVASRSAMIFVMAL
ncbi:hypothetical protein Sango_1060900 [Sesamum angolense]|uniref:Reverse transcriptase domain-containing protein n=1 Tax=Sesamum angolense TaxID=2727404 RepID=A0AAE2BZ77_9LAMI|nr:hypothetical protein Sango_1060900 [Sesamum angolense]